MEAMEKKIRHILTLMKEANLYTVTRWEDGDNPAFISNAQLEGGIDVREAFPDLVRHEGNTTYGVDIVERDGLTIRQVVPTGTADLPQRRPDDAHCDDCGESIGDCACSETMTMCTVCGCALGEFGDRPATCSDCL